MPKNVTYRNQVYDITTGVGSERRNESAKNIEKKVPKYSPRGQKTRAPKIRKHQKDLALFLSQTLVFLLEVNLTGVKHLHVKS